MARKYIMKFPRIITLQRSQYPLLTLGLSIALGIIFNLLSLRTASGFLTFPELIRNFGVEYATIVFSLNIAIAILTSIFVSTLIFKIRAMRALHRHGSGTFGSGIFIFSGTVGCPACTVPLYALIGLTGGLTTLPLQGIEFKLLSLALVASSLYWTSRGSTRGVSKIKMTSFKRKES